MIIDVAGKVRNLKLKASERLIPLFEAVVNSIQAQQNPAIIEVMVIRDTIQVSLVDGQANYEKINSFVITDYGVGFTDDNLKSFRTSDSSFKAELGCKGVGRFTWLKVFDSVAIESIYKEGRDFKRINFDFSSKGDDINNLKISDITISNTSSYTKVTLKDAFDNYKSKFPVSLKDLAIEIVQHCITYFLDKKINSFYLKDNTGDSINLLELFNSEYKNEIIESNFTIANNKFKASYVKNIKNQRKHKVILCANHRPVKEYFLDSYIANLPDYFIDTDGTRFRYSIYVMSRYLDENVNSERTSFSINESEDFLDSESPSIQTIISEILIHCDNEFSKYLKSMVSENSSRIERYVNEHAYEYKVLLKHKPELLNQIKYGLSDNELDVELHRIMRTFECELKDEANKIKRELKESRVISSGEYKAAYQKYTTALNDVGKSNLAKYVVHRKAILDIFDLSIEIQDTDKYALESVVHDIVFPMNATSEDVTKLSQNLWLIDERMAYHTLLASDQALKKTTNIDSSERPDLVIFNNPIIFSDDDRKPSTATIIEFKRPMRDDYTNEENPEKQVISYIKKLREHNGLKNNKGRELYLDKNLPIYCYIVCDLTKTIRDYCDDSDYISLPDNEGFMKFHKKYNTYIEILSFTKISNDARRRNNILFKELNLE
ncbi:TPA: hypothetical protein ACKRDC_000071 [Proteus mirabilis]|uniref:hypothetical protein n=1 Tax=Proteus mirabilis TaxID=584 RepID=UPI001B93A293|nr:hypothetical protein [Proteus mirabilis]MDC9784297.1 hypothetical protein [Proteus mirabilis]HBC6229789.1 ATP-binding protein [Proteus mirabilis]HEJ9544810.1 ATP-binding protein [Proteus mirabilis]HEJ9752015.1 ATP-binding protein [Proteus mirabilis]